MNSRAVKFGLVLIVLGGLIAGIYAWQKLSVKRVPNETGETTYHVEIVPNKPDTVRFAQESFDKLRIRTIEVKTAPPPEPLRLPGVLKFDPDRVIKVHSRFTGEIVRIGPAQTENGSRNLRYGDHVERDDLLAVVWSREIGEKKSELVDAKSKLDADRKTLQAYEQAAEGAVARMKIIEARRNVEADFIALTRTELTLRSWRLADVDINAIYQEADDVRKGISSPNRGKTWAELEIRAPISGLIVQKDFNEGAMIDPDDDLFRIADPAKLRVVASVYEEDLPALRQIPPGNRHWMVDLKSDPNDPPIAGTFDMIGTVIDQKVHTGVVLGWIDNSRANYADGQFITAKVDLPADPGLVVVPTQAVIEEGGATYVFVQDPQSRLDFTRRRVHVTRRGRDTVFVCGEQLAKERGCENEWLQPGEFVVTTMVLELSAELESAKSRAQEQHL